MTGYDVVIVGGRVAGACTAALCAEQDLSVLVLESSRTLNDTLSTHFFRGDGLVRILDRMGALDLVLATGAPPLRREFWYAGAGDSATITPAQEPGDYGHCLSVRRSTLDVLLADLVSRHPRIDYRTGVKAAGVLRDDGPGGGVVGVLDSAGAAHRGRVTVGADGRRSRVAEWVGADFAERHPATRGVMFRYVTGWRGPDGEDVATAEFSHLGDEMAYAFPSDGGTCCVAVSVSNAEYAAGHGEAAFDRLLARHRGFGDRYRESVPLTRVRATVVEESTVRVPAGPGWALVGDASAHLDPWSGLGMDLAARQAEALAAALGTGGDWAGSYRSAHAAITLDGFRFTTSAAADLSVLAAA